MKSTNKIFHSPYPYLLVIIVINLIILNSQFPVAGCDYAYFLPHLTETNLFLMKNGQTIQWYSPSFGGGVPAFPNPQNLQFTPTQYLTAFFNPWIAVNITVVLFTVIGFIFTYLLFKNNLKFSNWKSVIAACFFSCSPFFITNLSAGHFTFHSFAFIPLVTYILTNRKISTLKASLVTGLVFAYFIFAGGLYPFCFLVPSVALCVLLVNFFAEKPFIKGTRVLKVVFFGGLAGSILAVSKVVAILSFVRFFQRDRQEVYFSELTDTSYFEKMIGVFLQLFYTPIGRVTPFNPIKVHHWFIGSFTGSPYKLYEHDMGLSPFVLLLLVILIFLVVKYFNQAINYVKGNNRIYLLMAMFLIVWINFEWTVCAGIFYKLLEDLPFFRGIGNNIRWSCVYILPLIILSIYVLSIFERKYYKIRDNKLYQPLVKMAPVFTIIIFSFYAIDTQEFYCMTYDITREIDIYRETKNNPGNFKIVKNGENFDNDALKLGSSSICLVYEPVFGYIHKPFFKRRLHKGSIYEIDSGKYNITNPASLIFPEANNLELWERISIDDRENLEKFISFGKPGWKISRSQTMANYISAIAAFCWGVVLVFLALKKLASYFSWYKIRKLRRVEEFQVN